MDVRQERQDNRIGDLMNRAANMVVKIIGGLIFLILSWYSLRYTWYIELGGFEIPTVRKDSVLSNILALAAALLLAFALICWDRKAGDAVRKWVMRISVAVSVLWTWIWGYLWITAVDRVPEGDQAFVYAGASYFMEGQYSFLEPAGYIGHCPHQLPLIALIELLFRVVGAYNYFACQVIGTILAAGIVWLGYRLLWEMTGNCGIVVFYSILMLGCLPLIFYTSWVYGDLPSVFLSMLAAWFLLCYRKSGHVRWLIGIVPALTVAIMVRRNTVVFVIALWLVCGVMMLRKLDLKLLVTLVLTALCPVLACAGVDKVYELRSGISHGSGMSSVSYIAMGMQQANDKCGWYTVYCAEVFRACNLDTKMASEVSGNDIRERLRVFRADPGYAKWFYNNKIMSQWNEPLYESLYFSNKFYPPDTEEQKAYVQKFKERSFAGCLAVSDRIHFVVFVGTFLYFAVSVRRKGDIAKYLLAVTLIGGFFFSIVWEAKARYIMVYYVTMFPMAVIGYWETLQGVMRRIAARGERAAEDAQADRAA